MNRLDGKTALITGGVRGIGSAEARISASAGAAVFITDVDDAEGTRVAESIGANCRYLHQDVSKEDDWTAVVIQIEASHGETDVLVNNAGIFRVMGALETSLEDWRQLVAINQTGVFPGMRAVVPGMKKRRQGAADEAARMVLFLASDDASYCLGHKFVVDGALKS